MGKTAETKTKTRDPAERKKVFADDSVRLPDAFRSHCDKRKTKVLRLLKLSFQVGAFVPSGAENNIRPFAWCGVRFAYFDSQSPLGAATPAGQVKVSPTPRHVSTYGNRNSRDSTSATTLNAKRPTVRSSVCSHKYEFCWHF